MAKAWYVYSQGASFGPLETKVVKVMLQQKRVTLVEFIWCEGMDKWQRIRDVAEFGDSNLPPYPNVPIPSEQSATAEAVEEEAEEAVEEVVEEIEEEVQAEAEEVVEEPAVEEEEAAEEEVVAEEEIAEEEAVEEELEVEAEAEPEPEPAPAPKPKAKLVATKKVAARPAAKPVAKPVQKGKFAAKPKVAVAGAKPAPAAAGQQPSLKELMLKKAKAKKAGEPTKAYVTIRRHERIETDAVIELAGHGKFTLINMSVSGALLKSEKSIPAGTNLKLKFHCKELPKSPFVMTGVIVRDGTSQGKSELAMEFTRVNPAHKRALQAYVKGKLSGAKKAA